MTVPNKVLLRKYLLGNLSEAERDQLEAEYFRNDEAWSILNATEDDLIDSYVHGQLTGDEKKQFERHFLSSSERRDRLRFARLLLDPELRERLSDGSKEIGIYPTPLPKNLTRWKTFSAIGAVFAFALGAVLAFQNARLRSDLSKLQSEQTSLQDQLRKLREQNRGPDASSQRQSIAGILQGSVGPLIAIPLSPGLTRDGQGVEDHSFPLTPTPGTVVLVLKLERDDYTAYDVAVATAEGKEIYRVSGLKSLPFGDRWSVNVSLPSRLFRKGVYIANLCGESTGKKPQVIQAYSFTATK